MKILPASTRTYAYRKWHRDYGDLPDFADYNYIQKVARMNLSVLANLALAPAQPAKGRYVTTSGLTNKSTLKWEAPADRQKTGRVLRADARNHQPVLGKEILCNRYQQLRWITQRIIISSPYNR
jgi:hypothetical protein